MNNFNQYYPIEYSSNSNSNSNSNSPNFELSNSLKPESNIDNELLSFNQQGLNLEIQQKFSFDSAALEPSLNHPLDNNSNIYYSYSNAYQHQDQIPNISQHPREHQEPGHDISQTTHQPNLQFKSDAHSNSQPNLLPSELPVNQSNITDSYASNVSPQTRSYSHLSDSRLPTQSLKRGPENLDLDFGSTSHDYSVPVYSNEHPIHNRKDSQQPVFFTEDRSSHGSDYERETTHLVLNLGQNHFPAAGLTSVADSAEYTDSDMMDNQNEQNQLLAVAEKSEKSSESKGSPTSKKKKAEPSAVQENEHELKRLALNSLEIPMPELISNLRAVENDEVLPSPTTSHASIPNTDTEGNSSSSAAKGKTVTRHSSREVQKQVLAMIWLLHSCYVNPTSVVPRNKIYAKYALLCSNHNLFPLTPANLGRLVKTLFPQITIRRLGVRGQSKYHYCGIKLINEDNDLFNNYQSYSQFPLSPLKPIIEMNDRRGSNESSSTSSPSSYNLDFGLHIIPYRFVPLLFSQIQKALESLHLPFSLPSIHPYLPENIDIDIADTLYSLYKIYQSIMVESFQFNRLQILFNNFNNFNSILTSPVFKLYINEAIIPWIKACDLIGIKNLIKIVVALINQGVLIGGETRFPEVIEILRTVNENFTPRFISSVHNKIPKPLILIKLNSVKYFQRILSQFLKLVDLNKFLEFLNSSQALQALGQDIRQVNFRLLINQKLPVTSSRHLETLYYFFEAEVISLFTNSSGLSSSESTSNFDLENGTFLNQLVNIMNNLFTTFNGNSRLTLITITKFLNDLLKELNLINPGNFNYWYLIKTWVEEFVNLWFQIGGLFPELGNSSAETISDGNTVEGSIQGSRMGSKSPMGHQNISNSRLSRSGRQVIDLLNL